MDIFSRNIYCRSLSSKRANEIKVTFRKIFKEAGIKPEKIESDRGSEFLGNQSFFKTEKIYFKTKVGANKASFAEHAIQVSILLRAYVGKWEMEQGLGPIQIPGSLLSSPLQIKEKTSFFKKKMVKAYGCKERNGEGIPSLDAERSARPSHTSHRIFIYQYSPPSPQAAKFFLQKLRKRRKFAVHIFGH